MGSGREIERGHAAVTRGRARARFGAWLLAGLLAPLAASAQEPAPARLRGAALGGGQSIELVLAWRFQPGDDPRWAEPGHDDTGWRILDPRRADEVIPAGSEAGVAWFRRHLEVDAGASREPLRLGAVAGGELRVFLDGALVLETHGGVAEPGAPAAGSWASIRFPAAGRHLLAVRYAAVRGSPVGGGTRGRGFVLTLERQTAAAEREAGARRRAALAAIAIALPALLALVHLALYLSHRQERENLFYALAMLAFIGIVACDLDFLRTADPQWRRAAGLAAPLFILSACFFVLLTHQAVRLPRLARSWVGFAAAAVLLGLLTLLVPTPAVQSWSWYLYFAAMSLEIVRLEVRGPTVRRAGAPLLLAGLAALGAVILLQILINLGAVPPPAGVSNVYVFGILALAVAMSLFLAHTAAARSVQLERRLAEVRSLSEQVLSQERAALERALEARLLAAEHARKTAEIEAARTLQLSLLPRELPRPAGLEVAAAMTTASEVGGDYYDFRLEEGGSLVVAIGDATGHGVAAGTLVTAAKALFSALDLTRGLGAALAECDRALRGLQVRRLHMCLALARVTPRALAVSAAAMPPVLVCRASSGAVEEVGAGGLPLGAGPGAERPERTAALAPGDLLLFASDGLFEDPDPGGAAFGFPGVAAALGAARGASAGEVVERLLAHAAERRGGGTPADDITLVAVRVL